MWIYYNSFQLRRLTRKVFAVGFLFLLWVTSACKSQQLNEGGGKYTESDANSASVGDFEVTTQKAALAQGTYAANTQGSLVYSWTFSDQVLSDPEAYFQTILNSVSKNKGFQSSRDLPAGLGVGHGLYAASEPFVSRSYGDRLLVLRLRTPSLIMMSQLSADDEARGNMDKRIMNAVHSDAPSIMYHWQDGAIGSMAVVLRDRRAFDIVAVLDFSTGKDLASVRSTDLTGREPVELLKSVGSMASLLSLDLMSASLEDFPSPWHLRRGLGAMIDNGTSAAHLQVMAKALPDLQKQGFACAKQTRPEKACMREIARAFHGNEISGFGDFALGNGTVLAKLLEQFGYLNERDSQSEAPAAVESAINGLRNNAEALAGLKNILRQLPAVHAIFSKNILDEATLVDSTVNGVIDRLAAKFGNSMTVMTISKVRDDAGKVIGEILPGEFVTRLVTDRKTGRMKITGRARLTGTKVTGTVPAFQLAFGKLTPAGAD